MGKISPRVDIVFKKIFGVEENKDLLISLINSIVSEEDQVTEITLLNPYNAKNFKKDKLSILDIKAKGQNGKWFNTPMDMRSATLSLMDSIHGIGGANGEARGTEVKGVSL